MRTTITFLSLAHICIILGACGKSGDISIRQTRHKPIVKNAAELQQVALASSGGALGCGMGTYVYKYPDGTKTNVSSGLDAIHVFGGEIHSDVLLPFLSAREESNRTGEGPMSGERSSLLYVVLSVLGETGDASAVQRMNLLLTDPSESVRAHAKIGLIQIGNRNPKVQDTIAAAVTEVESDIGEIPIWETQEPQWLTKQP
jgi:hypothetical protein